jgi:hypothetical protein
MHYEFDTNLSTFNIWIEHWPGEDTVRVSLVRSLDQFTDGIQHGELCMQDEELHPKAARGLGETLIAMAVAAEAAAEALVA